MNKVLNSNDIEKIYLGDTLFILDNQNIEYFTNIEDIFKGIEIKLEDNIIDIMSSYISLEDLDKLKKYIRRGNEDTTIKMNVDKVTKWINIKIRTIDNKTILRMIDVTQSINLFNEESNKSIDYFSTMVHEFKTPLNLIFSSIQVLNKNIEKENISIDSLNRYISILNQNSYRILKLVNNISEKGKIDSSYQVYNPTNNDIVCFIENICDSVSEFISSNNMNIIFDTDIEELVVSFDMEKIERIILNLISNSIKFRKCNYGKLYIKLCHTNEFITIIVRDDGIGIPKQKLDSIFDKFSRINDENSIVKEGTGIGLYLVSSFVKLHGGTIDVDSKLGEWTEFKVNIPNVLCDSVASEGYEICPDRVEKIKVEFSDIYSINNIN